MQQLNGADGCQQGGILDQDDKFVDIRRQDAFECLRQDHLLHRLAVAQANGSGRLPLALIHSLNGGAEQFRGIGARVDGHRDGADHQRIWGIDIAEQRLGHHRAAEVQHQDLQHHGGAADHFHIDVGNDFGQLMLAHFQRGRQQAEN